MTPAIDLAKKKKISHQIHEYVHDSSTASYGLEAAEKLDKDANQIFKTLIVSLESKNLGVVVIPVSEKTNMKKLAKAFNVKKVSMAEQLSAQRATGYLLGGISPLGQKKRLRTVIDQSAQQYSTILVSAGRRGLEIELSPLDLAALTQALFADVT